MKLQPKQGRSLLRRNELRMQVASHSLVGDHPKKTQRGRGVGT